jgi:hypothetical protein
MLRAKVPREAACQPSLMRRRLDLALLLHRLLVLHGYTQCRRGWWNMRKINSRNRGLFQRTIADFSTESAIS